MFWTARPRKTGSKHRIRVASAEGLILLKLLAFRTQDQLDIENLVAANGDQIDVAWIQAEMANARLPGRPAHAPVFGDARLSSLRRPNRDAVARHQEGPRRDG